MLIFSDSLDAELSAIANVYTPSLHQVFESRPIWTIKYSSGEIYESDVLFPEQARQAFVSGVIQQLGVSIEPRGSTCQASLMLETELAFSVLVRMVGEYLPLLEAGLIFVVHANRLDNHSSEVIFTLSSESPSGNQGLLLLEHIASVNHLEIGIATLPFYSKYT